MRLSGSPDGAGRSRRDPLSLLGLAIQAAGIGLVFGFEQRPAGGFRLDPFTGAGLALFVASIWIFHRARRTLGREWSLTARVRGDHRLVTEGPFAVVRNPIYSALLLALVAAGVALRSWWSLAPAIGVYLLGTWLRVRCEERLLRERFGERFESYARRVPALFPRLL